MRQRAVVLEKNGREAVIEVSRATMCDGCEKNGGCEGHCEITGLVAGNGKMRTRALDPLGVCVGDTVEVETAGGRVLGYAALVFVLPLIMCAVAGAIANAVWGTSLSAVIGAIAGFALTFAAIVAFDKIKRKKEPDIVIVNIISRGQV